MKTSVESAQLRLDFYYKLEAYIQTNIGNYSVERFLDIHTMFRFSNGALIFSKNGTLSNGKHRYIPVGINNPYSINSVEPEDLRKFKLLFPFIDYKLNEFNAYTGGKWYKSEELLAILPTRANLITDILRNI